MVSLFCSIFRRLILLSRVHYFISYIVIDQRCGQTQQSFWGSPPGTLSTFLDLACPARLTGLGHVDPETFDFHLTNLDPTSPVGLTVLALRFKRLELIRHELFCFIIQYLLSNPTEIGVIRIIANMGS